MYELTDDYKVALSRLRDVGVIKAVSVHVKTQCDGVPLIIFKKRYKGEADEIQFLIETSQDLDLFQLSGIASFIQDTINYEGEVIARSKKWVSGEYASEMEKRILSYTEDNFEKLQSNLNVGEEASPVSSPRSNFFEPASAASKSPDKSSDTVLAQALRLMELAVADNPKNLEIIIEKAKELGSPKSGLDK